MNNPQISIYETSNKRIALSIGLTNAVLFNFLTQSMTHITKKTAHMILNGQLSCLSPRLQAKLEVIDFKPLDLSKLNAVTRLDKICINVTDSCNYKCKCCFHAKTSGATEVSKRIISWLDTVPHKDKISLRLLGGEPLLCDACQLQNHIKKWNQEFKNIIVFTNASKLNQKWLDFFKDNHIHIRLVLYSLNPKKHDDYTGVDGSFALVTSAIYGLLSRGVPFKVNLALDVEEANAFNHDAHLFNNPQISTTFELRRPSASSIQLKEGESIYIEQRKHMLHAKYRPLMPINRAKFIQNMLTHTCFNGKLFIGTQGDVFRCMWEQNNPLAHIDTIRWDYEFANSLEWYKPITQSYKACSLCEFSPFCFDCPSVNNYPPNLNLQCDKPYLCRYIPELGTYES